MQNNFCLIKLINVFSVAPTFLLPVFTDGNAFYFQRIENNRISSFIPADLDYFTESDVLEIDMKKTYSINEPAVYALMFQDNSYYIGNSNIILAVFSEYTNGSTVDPGFIKTMEAFKDSIKEKSTAMLPISLFERVSRLLWYNPIEAIEKIYQDSMEQIQSQLDWVLPHINSALFLSYELFENEDTAVYPINTFGITTTDNIFCFRNHIRRGKNDTHRLMFNKHSSIPVVIQLLVINTLFSYSPCELRHRTYRDKDFPSFSCKTWTYAQASRIFRFFESIIYQQSYYSETSAKYKEMDSWGLSIDEPTPQMFPAAMLTDRSDSISIIFDNYGITDVDRKNVYWLEVKVLDSSSCVIIAKTVFDQKEHFLLKDGFFSESEVIQFVEALFSDTKKKVYLLIVESEPTYTAIGEHFLEWVSENEDKCSIITNPLQTRSKMEMF